MRGMLGAEGSPSTAADPGAPIHGVPSDAVLPGPADPPRQAEAVGWLETACPYLRSADGTWRSVVAQRDQQCGAQEPPQPLDAQTQEGLCRTADHAGCR